GAGAGGDADGRAGGRLAPGHRQGDGAGLQPPDGAAAAHRPGGAGRAAGDRRVPARDARRGAVPPAGAPAPDGGGGAAREEERARLLRLEGGSVSYETLRVERQGAVGIVTIDRPEKRNALNAAVRRELVRAVEELSGDAAVRVLVFTGAGE